MLQPGEKNAGKIGGGIQVNCGYTETFARFLWIGEVIFGVVFVALTCASLSSRHFATWATGIGLLILAWFFLSGQFAVGTSISGFALSGYQPLCVSFRWSAAYIIRWHRYARAFHVPSSTCKPKLTRSLHRTQRVRIVCIPNCSGAVPGGPRHLVLARTRALPQAPSHQPPD